MIYLTAIVCQVIKSEGIRWHISTGFGGERYFVFLRICSFALFVSFLNILFKYILRPRNYKRLMAYACFILCLILLENYSINFKFEYQYYNDIERFKASKSGETVKIHFPPDYFTPGRSIDLTKK